MTVVHSVNRDNFKTCKTSSFCSRQREVLPNNVVYSVIPNSVILSTFGITANLSKTDSNQTLTLDVSYLSFSTFRITIDDPESRPSRYRLHNDDSLKGEPERIPVNTIKSKESVSLIGNANDKAVIVFNPFAIDLLLNGVIVGQLNRRSLFNFEVPSYQVEPSISHPTTSDEIPSTDLPSPPPPVEETTTPNLPPNPPVPAPDDSQLPEDTGGAIHVAPGEDSEDPSVDGKDEVNVEDAKEATHDRVTPDPFPWAENFKEHRDTRPYGPMSISMDVDFPGFSHLYGIPEHADSFVLKSTVNGDPYRLYNLDVFEYEVNNPMALYGSIPVLWALNENYTTGIFWHNPSETWVDVEYIDRPVEGFLAKLPRLFRRSPERYANTRWISESGVLDVFIMVARDPHTISKAYAHLTGTTPLPPLFALAYHQCRWNYRDESDVLSVDQSFDEHGIPLDVIWLDIEHTNGKRYFTWDAVHFPSPAGMVDKLSTKGRKLVTVVDPHMKQDREWDLYRDGEKNSYYVKTRDGSDFIGWCWPGSSAWPDFIDSRVRRWWAELFLKYHPVRMDSMFTWNDMGEPSVFSGPEVTMNKDTIHVGGHEHRDVHNIYGLQVHRATWDGLLLRSGGRERPFVLTRAFFAGSQRTAAVWTGDNTANWGHLEMSIPMLLSLSLTGITLCGADVGGFFGNTDPELLTRWYQAAAYQPFFRAHKHMDTKRHEPWTLPMEHLTIVREAIIQRYQLLPYWYTVFARAEASGQPVMAPVWYHFRHLRSAYELEHEYMLGEAILVCPVTASGTSRVNVYFPPGVWYQHRTLETFAGDRELSVPVNLSTIPVFYRGGWIVPRRDRVRRSSWLMRNDPFTLFVLIDPELSRSHGYLYDDDYHSVSREAARFYSLDFETSPDPTGRGVAGGRFRVAHIPIPGTTVLPELDPILSRVPRIERILFVGLPLPVQRATVIRKSGERHNVEFTQVPTDMADRHYMGTRTNGVTVVHCNGLLLSPDWELHLVTGTELKAEL